MLSAPMRTRHTSLGTPSSAAVDPAMEPRASFLANDILRRARALARRGDQWRASVVSGGRAHVCPSGSLKRSSSMG